jgi:hypothetical protein
VILPTPPFRYAVDDQSALRRTLELTVNDHGRRIATVEAVTSRVRVGTGTPEAVVTAPVGTLFLRTDGGANTTLYVKESGTGNTGWVAK